MSQSENTAEQVFTFDSPEQMPTGDALDFTLTEAAVQKLLMLKTQAPDKILRVRVKAGGCSGFQYEFSLEDSAAHNPQDVIIAREHVTLVIDKISAAYLDRAALDYTSALAGENFQIINPNAKDACGCGVSFSL